MPGPEDAAVNDILHDGKAGGRLEDAAQIVLADEEPACDLIQGSGAQPGCPGYSPGWAPPAESPCCGWPRRRWRR